MTNATVWTQYRWDRAKRLHKNGGTFLSISIALGLTETQVRNKFTNESVRLRPAPPGPPPSVLIERERATSATPSLTATLCGDPLPGRSALDRLRNGASA